MKVFTHFYLFIYFLFSTPAGNYSNNQTGTGVTILLCKVTIKSHVFFPEVDGDVDNCNDVYVTCEKKKKQQRRKKA